MIFKRIVVFCALLAAGAGAGRAEAAFVSAGTREAAPSFDLKGVSIFCDENDAEAVLTAAGMLSEDLRLVGVKSPYVKTGEPKGKNVIVIGTIEGNRHIGDLIRRGLIDVEGIRGGWERYALRIVENPFKGVGKALVVAGSDRRGAAYGALSISERIGVSPWTWWADVPVYKKSDLTINVPPFDSREPSVKYRGIFINDEDWGLLPWASKTFDPEFGNIGPKTYERVFQLLLRLKANYLVPAMHRRSTAFNAVPENRVLADRYGIVMGSTHCEPLLFNNASEWDKVTMGAWNYETNKEKILQVLDERVSTNCGYENVWTLALRGLHDKAMEGAADYETRKKILEDAIADQRAILSRHIDRPIEEIPQIFIPYKEVLDIYNRGMKLPDEVTIVWPDDNYGYLKQVSGPREQARSGRSGVYYHVSYHGKPHDYLWFSTTPPALMYEELSKVYRTGGDRLWVVNTGDIKLCEYSVDLFLRMAYDFESFDEQTVCEDQGKWLTAMFGEVFSEPLGRITREFYRLSFSSKPEFMGWGQEWNRMGDKQAKVTDTDYNPEELEQRLKAYEKLAEETRNVMEMLYGGKRAAFFELLWYPVQGSNLMNRMHLQAQVARRYAAEGRADAGEAYQDCLKAYDDLVALTEEYNSLLDGKWRGIAALEQGVTANYFRKPEIDLDSYKPVYPSEEELKGFFVEKEGVVSIPAAEFHRKTEVDGVPVTVLDGLSAEGKAVRLGDPLGKAQNIRDKSTCVEYDFYTFHCGSVDVYTYMLPTFLPWARDSFGVEYAGQDPADGFQRYGIMIDDHTLMIPSIPTAEYSQQWMKGVLHNCSVQKTTMNIPTPGRHTLKVLCADQGVVLQKIVIDLGGMKRSLLGPPSTKFDAEYKPHGFTVTDCFMWGNRIHVSGTEARLNGGVAGDMINRSFNGRLSHFITGPESPAIQLFEKANLGDKPSSWKGEHAGKWLYAASLAVERTGSQELLGTLRAVSDHLVSLQEGNGYLGCYKPGLRFYDSNVIGWDVWINSYMMQGLTEAWRATGEQCYLDAACRIADLFHDTFVVRKRSIADTGHHSGMVGTGSISPLADLYEVKREPKYKQLIEKCLQEMESTPGLQLLSKTEAGMDVALIGNGKIYELLRNLTGIAKYCRITKDERLLGNCVKAWNNIRAYHLNPCGGPWGGVHVHNEVFNRQECFSPYGVCETCSSMEWMRFSYEMLRLTGHGCYAEEIEKTFYNAILGAMRHDGEQWVYYTRLNGEVFPGNEWSCCWSSGMIAMEEYARMVFGKADGMICVNTWTPASDDILEVSTEYPLDGTVIIRAKKDTRGMLALRIPVWTWDWKVRVNGKEPSPIQWNRSYLILDPLKEGDTVKLVFPFKYRAVLGYARYENDGKFETRLKKEPETYMAVAKGPLVYAIGGVRDGIDNPITPDISSTLLPFSPEIGKFVTRPYYEWYPYEYTPYLNLNESTVAGLGKRFDLKPFYEYSQSATDPWRAIWLRISR